MANKMNSRKINLTQAVKHEDQWIFKEYLRTKINKDKWGQSINLLMRNPLKVILGNKIQKNLEKTKTF